MVLVETLQRQSEFDWYVAEDVPMVPTIWISVGDNEFRQLRMTRRHVGGSRTCIEEQWTLVDTRTEQVVERLTTSYAEPESVSKAPPGALNFRPGRNCSGFGRSRQASVPSGSAAWNGGS